MYLDLCSEQKIVNTIEQGAFIYLLNPTEYCYNSSSELDN